MKATALLLAFVISMIGLGISKAASTMTELKGSGKEVAGFAFTISNKELSDGSVKFRVVVTGDALRFNKYSTGLSVVTIKEDRSGRTESITGSRGLPSEKQEHSIVCEFSVKGVDLANPNLCFVFSAYEPHGMPSADFVYARLNKFAPPQLQGRRALKHAAWFAASLATGVLAWVFWPKSTMPTPSLPS